LETSVLQNLSRQELEQKMEVNSVLLLRQMYQTTDPSLKARFYEQAADQEASLISEVLLGAVKTDFKFETQGGKLYLLQPNNVTDWQEMHRNGVLRARAKADEDPGFAPYVELARAELEEARLQEAMVGAEMPTVMVKLSLCGDDLMSADRLEQLGRDPKQQRAYLRVSVFDGNEMHIHSRSIDGLHVADGRAIATGWGSWDEPQATIAPDASSSDILKNQLFFDEAQMSVEEMHQLADKLVGAFDTLQQSRTGRVYKAGRNPEGTDTYRFVLSNEDLLAAHLNSLVSLAERAELPVGHLAAVTNDLRYDVMSSFKQRIEGTWIQKGSLGESVAAAGSTERSAGTQFGGCDTVIGAQTAENAGYVNARGLEAKTKCVKCRFCRKIVDLPDKLLMQNIVHCVKCKASVHTKGGKVDQKAIDKFYGKDRDVNHPRTESIGEHLERIGAEIKQKQQIEKLREAKRIALMKKADLAEAV
jgi:hypothetical protein